MSPQLDQLRLAAALAHSVPDADLQLVGPDRCWLVSYRRAGATIDPCGFRRLVLALRQGCGAVLPPADTVAFVGALREIGGGVFERAGRDGRERRIATLLPPAPVRDLIEALPDPPPDLEARVTGDAELGVSVVTLTSAHPAGERHLDTAAHRVAAACLVEELVGRSQAGLP